MSYSQSYPSIFDTVTPTNQVLKNLDNETKKIYQIINEVLAANGHEHTGDGSDGAKISSNSLKFIQSGTGAYESTTVQKKLEEVVSVFDFMTPTEISDVQALTKLVNVTNAINNSFVAGSGRKVVVPSGHYLIDPVTKINVPNNSFIVFMPGAKFYAIAGTASSYTIMQIASENVTVINPVVVGERVGHTGSTGEHGHGIVITTGAKNVKVYNPVCTDCWGDGFVVYDGEDIVVYNLLSDNNRRQGLTITNGINVSFYNPKCINTNGTAPQSGIDIEPNYNINETKGIRIINPITENNLGYGITINLNTFINADKTVDIIIENHKDYGSYYGFGVNNVRKSASNIMVGEIIYNNGYLYNNGSNGIYVVNYAAENTPHLDIINPTVINSNTSGSVSAKYGSAISVLREVASSDTSIMGNISIINPTIIDNRAIVKIVHAIYSTDEKGTFFTNAKIIDPKSIYGLTADNMIFCNGSGWTIRDTCNILSYNATLSSKTLLMKGISLIHNLGATVLTNITLQNTLDIDCPITFRNLTTYGMKITMHTGYALLPINTVTAGFISTTDIGATITIRRISNTQCIVESMSGNWYSSGNSLSGSIVWNPASLADGAGETSAAITVTGASLGDFVLVSAPYDMQGITYSGYVSATDTVKIRIQNETASTIDLASGTWKVKVIKS